MRVTIDLTPAELSAVKRFKQDVWDKADEIDPSDEELWVSLAYGFFLACGIGIERASWLGNMHYDLMQAMEGENG